MIIIYEITLGSLFDGIGGFPYAAQFFGIKTLWASEIVPSAISITRRHFPHMEQVGDITKLDGGKLAPVQIVTFGSPCQSFSVAGQRTGLEGKSGLFWEAIRVMREMRIATNGNYPKYCIFENVPGILSSNKRRDFKTVLEAFTETEIPMPPSGKWSTAGMVRGAGIDFAWIIKDARHFGVSQRRRRLYAVADFTGQCAAEILFKPKSLHWYFAQGGATRKGVAANAQAGVNSTEPREMNPVAAFLGGQSSASRTVAYNEKVSPTLKSAGGSNMIPCICEPDTTKLSPIGDNLNTNDEDYLSGNKEEKLTVINDQGGSSLTIEKTEISPTLRSEAHGNQPIVGIHESKAFGICADSSNSMKSTNAKSGIYEAKTARTIDKNGGNPGCNQGGLAILSPVKNDSHNAIDSEQIPTCHPKITGTLCASGAGLSRPGGMCSETDLCVVQEKKKCALGFDLQQITSKTNRSQLKEVQPVLCQSGMPHVVISDESRTELKNDKACTSDIVAYCLQGSSIGRRENNGPNATGVNENLAYSLTRADKHCVATAKICDCKKPVKTDYIVRRLTPTECELLMGFPIGWTEFADNGKAICDTARYQALGNSVAIPVVVYVLSGIVDELNKVTSSNKLNNKGEQI